MKVYYLNEEKAIGKHTIVAVVYDRDEIISIVNIYRPYSITLVDEIAANKTLCRSIADNAVNGKYYVDGSGQVCLDESWQPPAENVV